MQKGNYQKFIHGFQFELNSDSVSTICKDKGAISIILDFHQIPHVEHRTFSLSPQKTSTDESLWTSIQNFAQKYNFDIVCKPNNGFSGRDVHHTRSQKELEKIVHKLLSIDSEFCISPFYKAEFEYRVIVINDRPELIWCKECFALVGDGHSKLKTLFLNYISSLDTQKIAKLFKNFDYSILTSDQVLADGEKFNFTWKHNEALGSKVSLHHNIDQEKKDKISNLALLTARKLNLFFASIDILDCSGEFKVLEAHTAVTMGPVIRNCGEEGYQKTKEVYDKVVRYMFDID